ncbi:MAG: ribosomal protein S18-alanine N-acetyltransferase [Tyzzerella sp.]|nr:ribosomal protein S18-alanine N-acetyltransferase [Tyzzerella sp.]
MLVFRNIEETDVSGIAELERNIFSDAWTSKSIAETIKQPQAFITVAEENGEIAGYCIIYYVLDEGEIARIAVNERWRRRGVGRRLFDYTCECCREKHVERLLLDVRESNESARAFYKNYGFEEDGIRKNFYAEPREHAVLMSKTLA